MTEQGKRLPCWIRGKKEWNDNSYIGSYHTVYRDSGAIGGLRIPCEEGSEQSLHVPASCKSGRTDYQWKLYAFIGDKNP